MADKLTMLGFHREDDHYPAEVSKEIPTMGNYVEEGSCEDEQLLCMEEDLRPNPGTRDTYPDPGRYCDTCYDYWELLGSPMMIPGVVSMSDMAYTNQEKSRAKLRLKAYLRGRNGEQICVGCADLAVIQGEAELGAGQGQEGPSGAQGDAELGAGQGDVEHGAQVYTV